MNADTELTNNKAAAEVIAGGLSAGFFVDRIDLNDETLADAYDGLKWLITDAGDIDTGVPGPMYYCLLGLPLTKAGTNFTGRSASTMYTNMANGGTFSTGIVEFDTPDTYELSLNNVTLYFDNPGTYDFRTSTITGTNTVDAGGTDFATDVALVKLDIDAPTPTNDAEEFITLEQNTAFIVSGPNVVDGSRVLVVNNTKSTILDNSIVFSGTDATDGDGYEWTGTYGNGYEIEPDDDIVIYVAHYDYDELTISRAASSSGITFTDAQVADDVIEAYGIEQSTAAGYTKFVADYPNIQFDFVGVGSFEWGPDELYAWYKNLITSEDGIITFFGAIDAIDAANLVIRTAVVDAYVSNPNDGTIAKGSNTISLSRDSGDGCPVDVNTDGSVVCNWGRVYATVVTVESGSVITGDIDEVAGKVWNAVLANYTSSGTTGKKLKQALSVGDFIAMK